MPRYQVWYSETYTYKAWFDADNEEHAQDLLGEVYAGQVDIDDLPSADKSCKNYELDIDLGTVEEMA